MSTGKIDIPPIVKTVFMMSFGQKSDCKGVGDGGVEKGEPGGGD